MQADQNQIHVKVINTFKPDSFVMNNNTNTSNKLKKKNPIVKTINASTNSLVNITLNEDKSIDKRPQLQSIMS